MRVGFDVDEVLLTYLEPFLEFHNETYGTQLKSEDFKSYNLAQTLGVSQEETDKRADEFHHSPDFTEIVPVYGSQEGIQKLEGVEKIVITSRVESIRNYTIGDLVLSFPNQFKVQDIYFSRHPSHTQNDHLKTKSEICLDTGLDVFVDDSLEHAKDCASAGIPVLLLDLDRKYYWNHTREEIHPLITRVYTWNKIVERINGMNTSRVK